MHINSSEEHYINCSQFPRRLKRQNQEKVVWKKKKKKRPRKALALTSWYVQRNKNSQPSINVPFVIRRTLSSTNKVAVSVAKVGLSSDCCCVCVGGARGALSHQKRAKSAHSSELLKITARWHVVVTHTHTPCRRCASSDAPTEKKVCRNVAGTSETKGGREEEERRKVKR